jgi:signal peptidase II
VSEGQRTSGFFMWALGLLVLDQTSKWLVRSNLVEGQAITVFPHALDVTLVYNRGIAFGLLQGAGVFLAPLAALVAIFAWFGYARSSPKDRLFRAGMTLLAAGAVGNLIDRLFNGGKVTDFVDIKIIHVFNVADACITVSAAMLILHWLLPERA